MGRHFLPRSRGAAPRGLGKVKLAVIDARVGKLIDNSKTDDAVTLAARDGLIVQHDTYGLSDVNSLLKERWREPPRYLAE